MLRHVSHQAVGRGQCVQGADQVPQISVAADPPEVLLRLHPSARHPSVESSGRRASA